MSTGKISTPWNDQLEKLLLYSMIEDPDNVSRAKFEAAAAKLGGDLSWNACRQKFYKLKKESENLLNGAGSPAGLTTPASSKTTKTSAAKSTGSKRKRAAATEDNDEAATPTKSAKKSKKNAPTQAEVKEELEAEENAVKAEEDAAVDE